MSKWTRFREWLNRNDGKNFRIENFEVNAYQAFAGILGLPTILVFAEKVPGAPAKYGWVLVIVVIVLAMVGNWRASSHRDAT